MKYCFFILATIFLLISAPDIRAHNLVTVNGNSKDHQHVYRRQAYGKPLQQGHRIQSAGGGGTIVWGSDTRPEYGKSTVRRSGPIIEDQNQRHSGASNRNSKYWSTVSRYGNTVQGYGKPVQGYGKPVQDYGKPDRGK